MALLVGVPCGFCPDRVGHGIGRVCDACDGLAERERREESLDAGRGSPDGLGGHRRPTTSRSDQCVPHHGAGRRPHRADVTPRSGGRGARRHHGDPAWCKEELRGAAIIAKLFIERAGGARVAMVDGVANAAAAPGGTPHLLFDFTILDGEIVALELVADPAYLDLADEPELHGPFGVG